MSNEVENRIKELIGSKDVFLFMKGDKTQPMCRFSASVISMLNQVGADYETYNILADPEVRQTLKDFSGWPTYPQLYVKGNLVGGDDIITDYFDQGKLEEVLKG